MGKFKEKQIATMESLADLWEEDIRNRTNAHERANKGYATNLEEIVTRGRLAILEGDGKTDELFVNFKVIDSGEL